MNAWASSFERVALLATLSVVSCLRLSDLGGAKPSGASYFDWYVRPAKASEAPSLAPVLAPARFWSVAVTYLSTAAVIALAAPGESLLQNFGIANVSYPSFLEDLKSVGADFEVKA